MNRFLVACSLICLSLPGVSQEGKFPDSLDLSFDAIVRSYPLGGGLSATLGNGLLLWESEDINHNVKNGFLYGFARPLLIASSSGYFNALAAAFELYPISFAGIRVGAQYYANYDDYHDFNCNVYECQGTFDRRYIEADIGLQYRKVFYLGEASRAKLKRHGSTDRSFIEPVSGLPAAPGGDDLTVFTNTVGYRINDRWLLALQHQYMTMRKTKTHAKSVSFNAVWTVKSWNTTVGLGEYDSDILDKGLMAIIKLEYIVYPKKYNKF